MAKIALINCFVEVDGVDLTDHISSVVINLAADEIDTTSFADDGKRRAAGLGDDSFQCNVQNDNAAGSVDEVLYPLHAAGSDFLVRVRASSEPMSATNPEWQSLCILLNYQPLAGDAGDLSQSSVVMNAQGQRIARVIA